MVVVSERHRRMLAEYADRLYHAGVNWIPMRYDNTPVTYYPNLGKRIIYGPLYMRRMDEETHSLFKKILLELPYVGGISVVSRVGGLLMIDFDPAKNSGNQLESRIAKLIKDYGSFIYIDRRISDKNVRRTWKGLKIGLFIDQSILSQKEIVYEHSYKEEINDKSPPPKTIFPSLRYDLDSGERSVYLKLSSIELWEAYYDREFKLLTEVMGVLNVNVKLVDIDQLPRR